jgi:low affinity Fe/Cu permease
MRKPKPKLLLRVVNNIYNAISTPAAIIAVALIIILWFILGIPMHYNDFWYKALHLFELLITLILVFIIEVAQKAEMRSVQEKLDELIKKNPKTDDKKAGIEKKYKGKNN